MTIQTVSSPSLTFAMTTLEDPLDIPMNLLYPIDKSISYKPLTGTSNCLDYAQRAADGGIAVIR